MQFQQLEDNLFRKLWAILWTDSLFSNDEPHPADKPALKFDSIDAFKLEYSHTLVLS